MHQLLYCENQYWYLILIDIKKYLENYLNYVHIFFTCIFVILFLVSRLLTFAICEVSVPGKQEIQIACRHNLFNYFILLDLKNVHNI